MSLSSEQFSTHLLQWFDQHGRHDLPWQQEISPYRVWVSEIMLQQTQVTTVIPYYQKFMTTFSTLEALAQASQEQVLAHWAGLGYYARGRNLHKAAQQIVKDFGGQFPTSLAAMMTLPGVGRSTAGAILSIACGERQPILDGNVKRVLGRVYALEQWPGEKAAENWLWQRAEELTPVQRFADYTQAIMDLGATLCTRSKPQCHRCPVATGCSALAQNRVADFPFKKPTQVKPEKSVYLMLLQNQQGQLWLERRPSKGIWGGLWSVPECMDWQACTELAQSRFGKASSLLKWEPFRHTFSHYHLQITPVLVQQSSANEGISEGEGGYATELALTSNGNWMDLTAVINGQIGVPAPVQKLVSQLQDY